MRTIRDEDPGQPGTDFEGARVLHVRPKSILVEIGGDERWIPIACIHENSEIYIDPSGKLQGAAIGEAGRLVIAAWFAEQEGLA